MIMWLLKKLLQEHKMYPLVNYGGHSIDLVPGKKQAGNTNDHSLYRNKVDTWTKTNINQNLCSSRIIFPVPQFELQNIWPEFVN